MSNPDKVEYELGEIVHYKVDDEQVGVITGIIYRPDGVAYMVTWEDKDERTHFACELIRERSFSDKKA
jgi:hypothetical protein